MIFATLKCLGKTPLLIETLNSLESGSQSNTLFSLMILTGISSTLHFLFLRVDIALIMSLTPSGPGRFHIHSALLFGDFKQLQKLM